MASSLAEKPRDLVFVSYSHADAQWRERLLVIFKPYMRKGHLSVWADPYIQVGEQWQREIDDALERVAIAIFLVSPSFLASEYVNERELPPILSAAADGAIRLVCIPIAAVDTGITDFQEVQWASNPDQPLDAMTEAERNAALVRIVKTINELNSKQGERAAAPHSGSKLRRSEKVVAKVRSTDQAGAKHGVPTQKPNFVPRPDDLERLKQAVLGAAHGTVGLTGAALTEEGHRVGLHGMGGIGKTELAVAFAHDPDVGRAFPDGIFWVTLGQEPEVIRLQAWLTQRLRGEPQTFVNRSEGRDALRDLLNNKAFLLVIDDVWNAGDASAFDVAGPQSRMLITTRDSTLLTALSANPVELEVLPETAALEVLALWSGVPREALPEEASLVAGECGSLPLALSLAGARVRDGTSWADVLAALERGRLEFLDHPYGSVFKSLRMSVDALSGVEARRYTELGVYPEDTTVPVESVGRLWRHAGDLEGFETRDLLHRLERKGLLYLGSENGAESLSFHDLQHDFLRLSMNSLANANVHLIEAYKAACTNDWASGPDDGYFFQQLPYHLAEAGPREELIELLTEYPWIQAKLNVTDVHSVLSDYDRVADEPELNLVQRALRLSSNALTRDPLLLPGQLIGRLRGFEEPRIRALLDQADDGPRKAWLRPKTGSLIPPGPLLQILSGHTSIVMSVVVMSDGRMVSGSWDKTLRVWDLVSGENCVLTGHTDRVSSVADMADGRVVSGSWDSTVRVWDLGSGESRVLEGHTCEVNSVAVMSDGRVVSGSWDKTVRVWDLASGSSRILGCHTDRVNSVAVMADGRVMSGSWDKTVRVWDLVSGENRVLEGHTGPVNSVAVMADGRGVSGSDDRTVRVWDLVSGECRVLECHKDRVESVAVMADGRIVSGSFDSTLRVWDLGNGRSRAFEGHTDRVSSIAVMADDKVVSGSWDSTVRVWDLVSGGSRVLEGHTNWVNSVAVVADGPVVSGSWDNTVRVWDLGNAGGRVLEGHTDRVNSVAVVADGWVVSGSWDSTVRVWNLASGESWVLEGHTKAVRSVSFLADGRVASGSDDKTVRVWDMISGESRVLEGHTDRVSSIAAMSDARVVSGSWDNTVRVWDLVSGGSRVLEGHTGLASSVVVMADNRVVSGSFDNTVRVWDLVSGESRILEGHTREVSSIAVIAESRVVSGSWDNTVRMWDLVSGESWVLEGHTGGVISVVVTADGRVVSGSSDNAVRVWDVDSGEQVAEFAGDSKIYCVAAASTALIAAGSANGAVHVLELRPS